MPWEETEDSIRSGHRDPDDFVRLRTITIDADKGIKAVGGPLKSDPDGGFVIQSYIFSKDKGWTMAKAKAWFKEHESSADAAAAAIWASMRRAPFALEFKAAVHSIETGTEEQLATFYLMNTTMNRNRWGVTEKALEDALPALLGKPIGLGEGYKEGHFKDVEDVGKFIAVEKPNGYALGRAEITDPIAWEKLGAGEWGPISVVINSYQETCSICGEELTALENPWEHSHIQAEDGYVLVHSFNFVRVDFVQDPAYPQAGMINFGAEVPVTQVPLQLLAGYYSNQGGAPGSPGASLNPEEKRKMTDEKIAELEQQVKDLKEANTTLTATIQAFETERHLELAQRAADIRFKAGITSKKEEDLEEIKEFDAKVLQKMIADAEKVIASKPKPQVGPATLNQGKDDKTAFEAAVEDARERIFGHRRDAEGKVI